jgi:ZIP family zinc transporter
VLEAAWWGFVGGAALLLGATVGVFWQVPHRIVGLVMAFAAGAILTMLADTMLPEAVEHAGRLVGLVTALGFVAAFLLSVT